MKLSVNFIVTTLVVVLFFTQISYLIAPPEGPMLFWREALTNMVSENLAFEDGTLLRPTVDHRSPLNRVFSSEFPVYNWLISGMMKVFGFAHNYGRFLSFCAYIVGLFIFFLFLKEENRPEKEVVIATSILALSSWFTHSTRIFPDLFATCLMLVSVFYGARFLRRGKFISGSLFVFFAAFGGLSKMPVFMVLGFLAYPWYQANTKYKLQFMLYAMLAILPAVSWYFFWLPHIESEGAHLLMFPTSISDGFHQIFFSHWADTKLQFSYYIFNGWLLSLSSALGLFFYTWKKENLFWLFAFVATLPLLALLMFKSGYTFATHFYYVIPIVPIASGLASIFLTRIPSSIALVIILVGATFSIKYKAEESVWTPTSYLKVKETVDRLDATGGPIASGFNYDPRFSYYSGRETFALWEGQFNDFEFAKLMRENGVKLLVLPVWPPYQDTVPYPLIHQDVHAHYYDFANDE